MADGKQVRKANMPVNVQLYNWQNFYVIIGSASAALIGLQFIVMALIADMRGEASHATISAFGTPTVVYLSGALLLSAIMAAPWPTLNGTSIALILCAIGGFAYAVLVTRRTHRQTEYTPEAVDWLWFVIVPCALFAALTGAAFALPTQPQVALFTVATIALTLVLVAIRNSWDTVLYLVTRGARKLTEERRRHLSGPPSDKGV